MGLSNQIYADSLIENAVWEKYASIGFGILLPKIFITQLSPQMKCNLIVSALQKEKCHSPTEVHFDYFQVLTIINKNIRVQVFVF